MVVLSSLIVNTIIAKGPYVFLNLAQIFTGEIDAVVYPISFENSWYTNWQKYDYDYQGVTLNFT